MPVDGMSAYKKGLNEKEKEQFDKNWDLIFNKKSKDKETYESNQTTDN